MDKRENVIGHLGILRTLCAVNPKYGMALSVEDCDKAVGWLDEAIAMLKAQEPVKPYTKRDGKTKFFLCGGCNEPLCIAKDSYKPKHCPMCGKAVMWDG